MLHWPFRYISAWVGPGVLFMLTDMKILPLVVAEPSICLVDSDPAVRDSLRGLFSLYGQTVRCYSTARAFLDEVDLIPVRCVICEARLPDQSGIDVHKTLLSRGLDVPFVLLVSRDAERVRSKAGYSGIPLVLSKPVLDALPLIEFIGEYREETEVALRER